MTNTNDNTVIRTTLTDNVGIVCNAFGLKKGTSILNDIVLIDEIPMGHKVALTDIKRDDAVIQYGQIIGYANKNMQQGEWVNENKLTLPEPPDLKNMLLPEAKDVDIEPLTGYTFQGYKNADGSVGTKNMLGITTSVQCVAGITDFIEKKIKAELLPKYPNVDGVVAFNHSYGCGIAIDAPAAIIPIRTIQNITQNPNFGGEIMIIGLGCEKLRPERLLPNDFGTPPTSDIPNPTSSTPSVLYLQNESFLGFNGIVDGIMALAEKHLIKLNARQRETCPASDLVVGMQCGGSDAFSGITGNPASGFASDLIVRAGGTVFFSEVTEVRDAVHLLVPRASTPSVAAALLAEMQWYDDYLQQGGVDRSANTTPGNKRGGLSNIVEEAKKVIDGLHYPPFGHRGVAKMVRATQFAQNFDSYYDQARDNILGVIQIETLEALENLDAIAALEGVDVLFIGPADLSMAMGIFGQFDHPMFLSAVKNICQAAEKAGKATGILFFNPNDYQKYHDMGIRFIACGADATFVAEGARAMAKKLNDAKGASYFCQNEGKRRRIP